MEIIWGKLNESIGGLAVSKLTFYSSEDKAAHEETKKKLEEFEKQAAETLKKIQQLNADRDELKEKIDTLEKNVEKMITAIQEKDKG